MFFSTNDRLLNYKSLDKFTNDHKHITKISRDRYKSYDTFRDAKTFK